MEVSWETEKWRSAGVLFGAASQVLLACYVSAYVCIFVCACPCITSTQTHLRYQNLHIINVTCFYCPKYEFAAVSKHNIHLKKLD